MKVSKLYNAVYSTSNSLKITDLSPLKIKDTGNIIRTALYAKASLIPAK
jgi:hypothetical protein